MRNLELTYGHLARILWDRRYIVITPIIVAFVIALGIWLFVPRMYTAWSNVLLDVQSSEPLLRAPSVLSPSYVSTQVDIIKSERVLLTAIRSLNLVNNPFVLSQLRPNPADPAPEEPAVLRWVIGNVRVAPSRESGVVDVGFTARDPAFAAMVATGISQSFVDTTLALKLAPAKTNSEFFDSAVKAARANLEKAQLALSVFQRENNIVTIDETLDVESKRLAELSSDLVKVQSQGADNQTRTAVAGKDAGSMQEVLSNPTIQSLKADVSRIDANLDQLRADLGTAHPTVKRLELEERAARGRLASETARVIASLQTSGVAYQQRELQARQALDAQKIRILKLRALRDDASVLNRDVETAQKQFDTANERLSQASLESQYRLTNVSILSVASKPVLPSSPQVALIATVLMFLGAMLGGGVAIAVELRDRKVRSPEDLAHALRSPVLAVFPDARSRRSMEPLSYELPQLGLNS